MTFLKQNFAKIAGATSAISAGLYGFAAHAAADADLTSSVTTWTTSVKENAIAVAGIVIPVMIIVALTFWGARKALSMIGAGRR